MKRSVCAVALSLLAAAAPALAWGDDGHELVNRAAARTLPEDAPDFLRAATARLTYLGPEPDRWRYNDLTAMNKAMAPDHFLDLEDTDGLFDPARPPEHRYAYIALLLSKGKEPDKAGLAPYRVVELCQMIEAEVVALELLELDADHPDAAARRQQAQEALIYVMGVLGHYVADLANPHHTTIHYNGWRGENPEKFATDRGVHARFESEFVRRIRDRLEESVSVTAPARRDLDYSRAVWELILESNRLVPEVYRLDRDGAFKEGNEREKIGLAGVDFATRRMSRGAQVLRDLWTSAIAKGKARATLIKLRERVRRALLAEGIDVWVDIDDEGNVTLNGTLPSHGQASRALELARGVPGVKSVTNKMRTLY